MSRYVQKLNNIQEQQCSMQWYWYKVQCTLHWFFGTLWTMVDWLLRNYFVPICLSEFFYCLMPEIGWLARTTVPLTTLVFSLFGTFHWTQRPNVKKQFSHVHCTMSREMSADNQIIWNLFIFNFSFFSHELWYKIMTIGIK